MAPRTTVECAMKRLSLRAPARAILGLSLLALLGAGCGAHPQPAHTIDPLSPLSAVVLPDLPIWTDPYHDPEDSKIFFDIDALMQRYDLSRLQATELQYHVREQLRAHQSELPAAFEHALQQVRAQDFFSGADPQRLASARFIVVFDLDETLLEQGRAQRVPDDCRDFGYTEKESSGEEGPRNVKLNPDWQPLFEQIRGQGGAIVLFSANIDERTRKVLQTWQWEGKSLLEHPDIVGRFSNSHLSRTRHYGKPGPNDPAPPTRPIAEPSKDLRLFDETLTRVVLLDDNPLRVFQYRNLRWIPKFRAKHHCAAQGPQRAIAQEGLKRFQEELTEALGWLDAHEGATFKRAFLPYTFNGSHALKALLEMTDLDREQAMALIRSQPQLVEVDL